MKRLLSAVSCVALLWCISTGSVAGQDAPERVLERFAANFSTLSVQPLRCYRHRSRAHIRLDVLVNNAGITGSADDPPDTADINAVRRIFDTILFGALAVTLTILSMLRKSGSARADDSASA